MAGTFRKFLHKHGNKTRAQYLDMLCPNQRRLKRRHSPTIRTATPFWRHSPVKETPPSPWQLLWHVQPSEETRPLKDGWQAYLNTISCRYRQAPEQFFHS